MPQPIKQNRSRSPMWYFEQNYSLLLDMLKDTRLMELGRVQFELGCYPVALEILEKTRYTLLLKISQQFASANFMLADVVFTVRVYQDAQLAEVISYQGRHGIQYKYPYPNEGMYAPDEKRQCNLLLHDWLNACSRLNYKETLIESC